MRTEINLALDQIEDLYKPIWDCNTFIQKDLGAAIGTLQLVQDAYVEIIQQALKALMNGNEAKSHDLLQTERQSLTTTLERIADVIEEVSETDNQLLKQIIEYLFTRARLVDELKMFPQFGMELLDKMSFDESLDETIFYMETVMTGKQNLYQKILQSYGALN